MTEPRKGISYAPPVYIGDNTILFYKSGHKYEWYEWEEKNVREVSFSDSSKKPFSYWQERIPGYYEGPSFLLPLEFME